MKVSQLVTMVALVTFGCSSDHGESALELDASAADGPVTVTEHHGEATVSVTRSGEGASPFVFDVVVE